MKKRDRLNELKKLDVKALGEKARTLAEELMRLRFRHASGQLEQSSLLNVTRRDLARTKTLLTVKLAEVNRAGAAAK